jgi:hypothetical protein
MIRTRTHAHTTHRKKQYGPYPPSFVGRDHNKRKCCGDTGTCKNGIVQSDKSSHRDFFDLHQKRNKFPYVREHVGKVREMGTTRCLLYELKRLTDLL